LDTLKKWTKTNLVERVREELKFPGHMKRGRPKKSWDEVGEKEYEEERLVCINDAQDGDKWRRCCRRVVDPG